MEFQAELFLKSVKKFSKLDNYTCSVGINPDAEISNQYVLSNSHVFNYKSLYGLEPPWRGGLPRWEYQSNADVTIISDADILCCNDVRPLVNICYEEQAVCGVQAH